MSREIRCPACGRESLLLREPVYEGFTKVGEALTCSGCGHVFDSEDAVPYVARRAGKVFTERDRSTAVRVFDEHEADRLCRHCVNYTVNPFRQWCGLHRKEVEATDTCADFAPRPPPEEPAAEESPPPAPIL